MIPAEVLTLHAVILSVTTSTTDGIVTITDPSTLRFAFFGILVLSVVLYASTRLVAAKWNRLDWLRMMIPPVAFIGWTMLQRTTAFDAVFPGVRDAPRTVIALFLSILLGLFCLCTRLQGRSDPSVGPGFTETWIDVDDSLHRRC